MDKSENRRKDLELETELARLGFDLQEMFQNSIKNDHFIAFTAKVDNIDFEKSVHKVSFFFLHMILEVTSNLTCLP